VSNTYDVTVRLVPSGRSVVRRIVLLKVLPSGLYVVIKVWPFTFVAVTTSP